MGFGDYGDDHVRFALIENQDRIRQAVRGIKQMFRADGLLPNGGPAQIRRRAGLSLRRAVDWRRGEFLSVRVFQAISA